MEKSVKVSGKRTLKLRECICSGETRRIDKNGSFFVFLFRRSFQEGWASRTPPSSYSYGGRCRKNSTTSATAPTSFPSPRRQGARLQWLILYSQLCRSVISIGFHPFLDSMRFFFTHFRYEFKDMTKFVKQLFIVFSQNQMWLLRVNSRQLGILCIRPM